MDTRYLRRRGDCWHLDFCLPDRVSAMLGINTRIRASLETADLLTARRFRDRYIVPFISAARGQDVLLELADRIVSGNASLGAELRKLLADRGATIPGLGDRGPARMTLRDLGDAYVAFLVRTHKAPASVRKYRATMTAACSILGAKTDAEALTTDDVAVFRDALLAKPVGWQKRKVDRPAVEGERKLSESLVSRELDRLRAVIRWGIGEGKLHRTEVPGAKVNCGTVHDKAKVRPTLAQAEALCALPFPRAATKAFDREAWETMPVIARYSAMRIGEIAGLTVDDVVDQAGILCFQVRGDHLKTAASERMVPVADKLKGVVAGLLKLHPSGRLFPHCGDWEGADHTVKAAHYFLKAWNVAAKRVGPFSIHCLRVYANSAMADAGVDMIDRERIVGHVSGRTQAAYTPADLGRFKRAVDSIP